MTGPGILDFDCGLDGAWSDGFWAPQNSPFHSSLLVQGLCSDEDGNHSVEDDVGSAHGSHLDTSDDGEDTPVPPLGLPHTQTVCCTAGACRECSCTRSGWKSVKLSLYVFRVGFINGLEDKIMQKGFKGDFTI